MTNLQSGITNYWNQRSETYDISGGHHGQDLAERTVWLNALPSLVPPPPAAVLDVGTGTGFLAGLFAELGYRTTGIDVSEGMMDQGRKNTASLATPPVFAQGDAHDPGMPVESVDILSNRHVLWTLHDPATAFRNWVSILRPGGTLLCFDSLWFLNQPPSPDVAESAPLAEAWRTTYSTEARDRLPIMRLDTLDPVVPWLEEAGFVNVRLVECEPFSAYYRQRDWMPSDSLPRYLITALKPG